MKYIIFTDGDLFNRWRELESKYGVHLLAGLLQNDCFIPTEELNKEFEQLHETFIKLHETFTPSALKPLADLRDETHQYIIHINTKEYDPVLLHHNMSHGCPARREKGTDKHAAYDLTIPNKNCYCAHPENLGNPCELSSCPTIRDLEATKASLLGNANA